jgi:hypothetical protein
LGRSENGRKGPRKHLHSLMPPSSFAMGGAKRNPLIVPYLDLREMNAGMIWILLVPSCDMLMLPSRLLLSWEMSRFAAQCLLLDTNSVHDTQRRDL